jgi:hypothetical protein
MSAKKFSTKKSRAEHSAAKESGGGDKGSDIDESWYQNNKVPLMYLVVLMSSMSLPYFRKLNLWLPHVHPALVSLLAGLIVTVITYGPMRYTDPKYALSNALLLGLLVAEFAVYGAPKDFPAPVAISFFFFMFSYGNEEADHLWPPEYKN